MLVLPIFTRDLGPARRNARLRHDRVVSGAIAGVMLVVCAAVERFSDGVNIVRVLRGLPLAGIVPCMLLLVGLSLGARLLAIERREGTLPLLLLTHLSGQDILIGKVLMAFVAQLNALLAIVPALVLPFLLVGMTWPELCLFVLGSANVLFFGLALGLLAAVFLVEEKAISVCFLLILPFLVWTGPFGILLPGGRFRELLSGLQLFNPSEALGHVQSVAGGFRRSAFWAPLFLSHLLGWALLLAGGQLLGSATRWQAGRNLGPRTARRRQMTECSGQSFAVRARLLSRNPILWLTTRNRWATIQAWLYMGASGVFWGWLAWFGWALRGLNITIVFVIALAVSWLIQFLVTIPSEASRRLAEDRQTGALELLLCTPLAVERIVWGQWLALGRRYFGPILIAAGLSLGLMTAGYFTDGFGGMLDTDDRGLWLFAWLSAIGLMPLMLVALCWVSMRRALISRNYGDASAIAILQVIGVPCMVLPASGMLLHSVFGWNSDWRWTGSLFVSGLAITAVGSAWRARRILYRDLRTAAAQRYSPEGMFDSATLPQTATLNPKAKLAPCLEGQRPGRT